ncbi:hypothetical protein GIY09_05885 [Aerococcaceae bacterium WS4759]|uniref:Iron-sulfur cluster biosynthesis protein n=1 Tax=Fundicoccus ignavus TaxID=2664442 RepID=A0A6I2GDQ2_9LACT|nr:hypothetical protein [Fundicoccus ignavus]MRI85406.1 hypothetical protein [Fundicoccus ignavus]
MKLTVDKQAAAWFKEEVGIREGAGIRIKAKIYGGSPVREGFGLAIDPIEPLNPIVTYKADNGVLFFVEDTDEWFFDGHDLNITLNEHAEPHYVYLKDGVAIN